ncbi:PREDICTED: uncharacterized protein LOC101307898 [Fragaria vesca subsp. vesca]
MTCRAYYAYVLQIRLNEDSVLLRGGRLLQQYAVDNYVKIETQKLRYIRNNQPDLRCEFYNGLHDSLNAGEDNAGNIGRRIILPSTFIGSPRDMHQRYQDAMALVQKYGKPDIFLTMTCNPNWDEIKAELLPGQTSQDRPDLCTRIFRAKLENLKEEVIKKGVLGKIIVYVYVIEFQKRGLPHAHMLLMLHDDDKLNNPDDYDKIVRAELPDQDQEPQLYDVVLRHMIHGPCGTYKPNSPCMKGGNCKRGYPKPFSMNTFQGNDSYPNYRRRDIHSNANVDNRNQDLKVTLWGTLANELDIDMIASLLPPVVIVLTSTEVRHFGTRKLSLADTCCHCVAMLSAVIEMSLLFTLQKTVINTGMTSTNLIMTARHQPAPDLQDQDVITVGALNPLQSGKKDKFQKQHYIEE